MARFKLGLLVKTLSACALAVMVWAVQPALADDPCDAFTPYGENVCNGANGMYGSPSCFWYAAPTGPGSCIPLNPVFQADCNLVNSQYGTYPTVARNVCLGLGGLDGSVRECTWYVPTGTGVCISR